MKNIIVILLLLSQIVQAQNVNLSGVLTDANNGETLIGASVFLEGTTIGSTTNEYGFYSISAKQGNYTLVISYIGYDTKKVDVQLKENLKLNFELNESSETLDEVTLSSEEKPKTAIRKPEMGTVKLQSKTIKQIPVVLGEVDVLKSIQTLPGVSNGGDGTSGFNIRGGAVDQNLVLLDEAIIYNTSHLLGFVSVFNADAIKDIKLYKGSIPAQFGGRTFSVLDVRQKDGNSKQLGLTGGIGIISSRLAVEGPWFKDKGSFLVAGRGSYAHLFMKMAKSENSASFYDINLKGNYQLNTKNKLYLSAYLGRDDMSTNNFGSNYGNATANLRWNHMFTGKLFSNLSLIYTNYDYQILIEEVEMDWRANIMNTNFKYDFKYYRSDKMQYTFGVSAINYEFQPGKIKPTTDTSPINRYAMDKKHALEGGLYLNAEHKITSLLTASYGLRQSAFFRLGNQPLPQYKNNEPVVYNAELDTYEEGEVVGIKEYGSGDLIKDFYNLEPRIGLSYQLSDEASLKGSYNRSAQYVHLLSNTTSVTPVDVWTPSGEYIKPQLGDQFAFGYFKNFSNQTYSLEIETYYKTVKNRIDYVDGSNLIGNNTIETELMNGKMKSYGVEVLLRKNSGKLTGWLAYTLSKSQQKTEGGTLGGDGINNGDWYNANHDRTHDLSLTAIYKINDKWSLSANLAIQSGRPVTYPNGKYVYDGVLIANYAQRNANRLPLYHRLDVGVTYIPNKKPDNKWKGEWNFGIYNLYNQKNASTITFGQNAISGLNEAKRTAIFGIIPSVSYNFKF
ncbi:MAG: TonB-dependent receptor [Flavobacteriales bacterium]